jgi:hypothetical protein
MRLSIDGARRLPILTKVLEWSLPISILPILT